jgi:hypothetical protein
LAYTISAITIINTMIEIVNSIILFIIL